MFPLVELVGRVAADAAGKTVISEEDERNIHMPGLSYFPIVVALGLAMAASGILIHLAVIAVGVLVTFFGIYGWAFEPADQEH